MQCDRYSCILTVAACLKNQARTLTQGLEVWGRSGYINCANCPQAEAAQRGEYNDDDVAALKEGAMTRICRGAAIS